MPSCHTGKLLKLNPNMPTEQIRSSTLMNAVKQSKTAVAASKAQLNLPKEIF